jgi:hypothetical protein
VSSGDWAGRELVPGWCRVEVGLLAGWSQLVVEIGFKTGRAVDRFRSGNCESIGLRLINELEFGDQINGTINGQTIPKAYLINCIGLAYKHHSRII